MSIMWECPRCGRLFPRKDGAYHCMYGHWPVRDDPYELDR